MSIFCENTDILDNFQCEIGLSIRYPKTVSIAMTETYKTPKKALTNQLTKSIKKLPEISLKIYPPNWLK